MSGDIFFVGEEHHPLPIRRNVREPVVEFVRRDLFLPAAVGMHAPDLHGADALGVEVNVFAIRRILRPIVESLGRSQAGFVSACDWDGVDIEISVSLSYERQRGSIRRPSMPVGRGIFRDPPGRAALDGHHVNQRAVFFLRLIADGQPFRIGRNPVIVVAADWRNPVSMVAGVPPVTGSRRMWPLLLNKKRRAIPRPVGRFEVFRRDIDDAAVGGGDRDSLQSAVKFGLARRQRAAWSTRLWRTLPSRLRPCRESKLRFQHKTFPAAGAGWMRRTP